MLDEKARVAEPAHARPRLDAVDTEDVSGAGVRDLTVSHHREQQQPVTLVQLALPLVLGQPGTLRGRRGAERLLGSGEGESTRDGE